MIAKNATCRYLCCVVNVMLLLSQLSFSFESFAQGFHYFEDPFYKFFALNLLFQDTSYNLALKYSIFFV